jgi:hypothetical protein
MLLGTAHTSDDGAAQQVQAPHCLHGSSKLTFASLCPDHRVYTRRSLVHGHEAAGADTHSTAVASAAVSVCAALAQHASKPVAIGQHSGRQDAQVAKAKHSTGQSSERSSTYLVWCVQRGEDEPEVCTNSRLWQKYVASHPHALLGLLSTLLRTIRSRNTTSDWRAASPCGLGRSIGCR